MRARLSRVRPRDLALFLVVTAVVAAVGVVVGREAGIGQQTGASVEAVATGQSSASQQQRSEEESTMTLTLTAPDICEVEGARHWGYSDLQTNADGVRERVRVSYGWRVAEEIPVSWRVEGGTPPYTLVIDGEERDAGGAYAGPAGDAMVSCANSSVETFFEEVSRQVGVTRLYRSKPHVDSGWKTITAVVTDANGGTAQASVDVYLIRSLGSSGEILTRGETYRVLGHLLTAPVSFEVEIGGMAEKECPEEPPPNFRCETEHGFSLVGIDAGVVLYESDFAEARRWNRAIGGADGSGPASVETSLDALADSVGQMPQGTEAGE
ncbi:MAG: hypothetical protein OXG27_07270 [Chloroflexi bacterium]|nr:hypothetical protein [Chloroflexota bacterium]